MKRSNKIGLKDGTPVLYPSGNHDICTFTLSITIIYIYDNHHLRLLLL